jgi:hypothetical protein
MREAARARVCVRPTGLRFSGGPDSPAITQQNATTGARRKMDAEPRRAPALTQQKAWPFAATVS